MKVTLHLCEYIKRNGQKCNRKAKYKGENYSSLCGTHCNVVQSHDECSICYEKLTIGTKLKLDCGHIFHIKCLQLCVKKECPLCRTKFSQDNCFELYKDIIIKPLVKCIFSFTETSQQRLFDTINLLIKINLKSEWLNTNIKNISERLSNTHLNEHQIQNILIKFEDIISFVEIYDTLPE